MLEVLIYPMLPFVFFPGFALFPVAIFSWLSIHRFRTQRPWLFPGLAAIIWLAYATWETSFKIAPVREWIRIDLILISPILIVVTIVALISAYRNRATLRWRWPAT